MTNANAVEAVARALYETAQRENGNPSALPWSLARQGSTANRWYIYARAAIEAMPITAHVSGKDNAVARLTALCDELETWDEGLLAVFRSAAPAQRLSAMLTAHVKGDGDRASHSSNADNFDIGLRDGL